jgi:hypothetical protein
VAEQELVIVKTYVGSQSSAAAKFRADATRMAEQGYYPTSQSWAPGSYGCGSFLLALILCIVVVGILIFIYMLLVPPEGTLSVTYEFRNVPQAALPGSQAGEKTCPKCAEQVKAAAQVCRFCGHSFLPASGDDC